MAGSPLQGGARARVHRVRHRGHVRGWGLCVRAMGGRADRQGGRGTDNDRAATERAPLQFQTSSPGGAEHTATILARTRRY